MEYKQNRPDQEKVEEDEQRSGSNNFGQWTKYKVEKWIFTWRDDEYIVRKSSRNESETVRKKG